MNLLEKLEAVANAWVVAWQRTIPDASLKTLGVRAMNNSKLFERNDMLTATYERVLGFLSDPANWPLALVPADAVAALDALGVVVADEHRVHLDAAA